MTLQEAHNFFESLKNNTTKKNEIKLYQKYLHILSELKKRTFQKDEMQSIKTTLDSLQLDSNPANKSRYYSKALRKFESYLKSTFSLTLKGYYTNLGLSLGMTFGLVIGVIFGAPFNKSLSIALGISFGTLIGLLLGMYFENQAKAQGNIL